MAAVIGDMSMSLDGFIAGPKGEDELQAMEPLHAWMFPPIGDFEQITRARFQDVGAVVMGRRMFDLGEEPWGNEPAFHMPVFVLTHNWREPLIKDGGTTFFFVKDGVESALEQAKKTAGERNVMVLGGANAMQQFLKAGLLDELHLTMVPTLLGQGIQLFENTGAEPIKLETMDATRDGGVMHARYRVAR